MFHLTCPNRKGGLIINYIGKVIKQFRTDLGMSQKELAEDICTEKYIYLIEKGDRTPTVDLVRDFSDKLGVNLFDYYQYLDCSDPIMAYKTINAFNKYRTTMDYDLLQKATHEALKLPDFHVKPWIYEIEVNRFYHLIFVEQKHQEAINGIEDLLSSIAKKYLTTEYTANFYILLSTGYQAIGDLAKAKQNVLLAYEIIKNKKTHHRYKQIIISVYLNIITLCYFSKDYDRAIENGLWLNQFQIEHGSDNRAHFTFFYLAFAYYQKGNREVANKWFMKGMRLMLLEERPLALFYIASFEPFRFLLDDIKDTTLINDFMEIYDNKGVGLCL